MQFYFHQQHQFLEFLLLFSLIIKLSSLFIIIKLKMYNDIYKTYATETYADIQNQAKRNRENWIGVRDPILQRTDNYVCIFSLSS